jgi:thiol-disulfide isomerase/thioredoxin
MKKYFLFLFISALGHAQTKMDCHFAGGGHAWNAKLKLNDSISLSFYFKMVTRPKPEIYIYNAGEVITVTEIKITADSIYFKMPVFDSEFRCKWQSKFERNDSISGVWINHARKTKNIIPFSAKEFIYKTAASCYGCSFFEGKWETTFSPGDKENEYKALGIFATPNCWDFMYGTFLTETGDYRYLCGTPEITHENKLKNLPVDTFITLQCFDGSHAFVFKGKKLKDGTIAGDFYSGAHWHEKWVAKKNDDYQLTNPDSLTYLKNGTEKINFSFKNLEGKTISLTDEKYKNKVIIVQVMGSWCPNCMDETRYLSEFYKKYKSKGIEIIALAFEKDTAFEKAKYNCERLKKKFDVQYDILLTQKTGKDQASNVLPMLNAIMSFPTTIYIDKNGVVRKIHTGFNGPGTGEYYEKWTEDNLNFIEKLLNE